MRKSLSLTLEAPPMRKLANDPAKAGQKSAKPEYFGLNSRYAIYPIHTRFDAVEWFVADAQAPDPRFPDRAGIIRQAATREEALAGLRQIAEAEVEAADARWSSDANDAA